VSIKTANPTPGKTPIPSGPAFVRSWFILDANGAALGRIASQAAKILMGKHRPTYTPFLDTGDHVIILNAAKVKLTGGKEDQKIYRTHSGYPGGLKETGARKMRQTHPDRMLELAIKGMLPKTKLGKQMYRKLNVYAADRHPHQAQKPTEMPLFSKVGA
jgi:large subunit ribosomal protein L13